MTWIEKYKRNWRGVLLILLILAIIGPWGFDQINVPAEYDCGPTNIRLEGDFCGLPISFIRTFFWMVGGFFNMMIQLITGKISFSQTDFNFWIGFVYSLVSILPILPIINLSFLIQRGDRPRFQKFHLVICGLNLGLVLLLEISHYPKFFYVLWGIWLYTSSLAMILFLEGILLKQQRSKIVTSNNQANLGGGKD